MAIQLLIDGIDLTWALQFQTVQFNDVIGERSTCGFELQDNDGSIAALLQEGMPVAVL